MWLWWAFDQSMSRLSFFYIWPCILLTAVWLARLGQHQAAEQEVVGSNPDRTNTQGLKITEKKVLPL